jgi:hypothetical protein
MSASKYWIVAGLLLIWLCGAAPAGFCDFKQPQWQYSKRIDSPAVTLGGYLQLALDSDVYQHGQVTLADLRLVDDLGKEIPFALHEEREVTATEEFTPHLFNQAVLPGAYSTLTLDLGKQIETNKLVVHTTGKNFKRRVEIEGSSDGQRWLLLKKDGYVFDFSGDQNVQVNEVRYPNTNYRYLRIKVWNNAELPLEISSVSSFFVKTITPPRVLLKSQLLSRVEDPKLKATACVLDLGFVNLPSDWVAIATPEENFSRVVEIRASNDQKEWRTILQTEFYRFHTARYAVEKISFQFPEARARYLKILVYNNDDRPLQLAEFQIKGIEKTLIFKSEAGRTYWLFYGNPQATAPHYDVEKTQNYLSVAELLKVKLAGELANKDYVPAVSQKPWTERYPLLFWGMLVLLVVGLGTYIVKLMMKVKA